MTDPSQPPLLCLDATVSLSRNIAALGLYPAIDPPQIQRHVNWTLIVGQEHYDVHKRFKLRCNATKS
ncbi:hypothetical protein OH492_17225 [Vibrio chagasii]|nr:hypothetical protein [Vibrio chagasii]